MSRCSSTAIGMMTCKASTISIRRAVSSDVPQVASLMRLVSDREHSIEAARKITSDFMPGEFYGWLAFADEEAVGVTMLEPCILARGDRHSDAGYWRYLWV